MTPADAGPTDLGPLWDGVVVAVFVAMLAGIGYALRMGPRLGVAWAELLGELRALRHEMAQWRKAVDRRLDRLETAVFGVPQPIRASDRAAARADERAGAAGGYPPTEGVDP